MSIPAPLFDNDRFRTAVLKLYPPGTLAQVAVEILLAARDPELMTYLNLLPDPPNAVQLRLAARHGDLEAIRELRTLQDYNDRRRPLLARIRMLNTQAASKRRQSPVGH